MCIRDSIMGMAWNETRGGSPSRKTCARGKMYCVGERRGSQSPLFLLTGPSPLHAWWRDHHVQSMVTRGIDRICPSSSACARQRLHFLRGFHAPAWTSLDAHLWIAAAMESTSELPPRLRRRRSDSSQAESPSCSTCGAELTTKSTLQSHWMRPTHS